MGCEVTGELLGDVVTGFEVGVTVRGDSVTGLGVTGLADVGLKVGELVAIA